MLSIPECDWKVLKELHPVAMERFCQRVLSEAQQLIAEEGTSSHDRYLALDTFIKDRNRELVAAFDDYRRSTAVMQLRLFHNHKLLTKEELGRLSDETREFVERVW